jgi:hypothetical protein
MPTSLINADSLLAIDVGAVSTRAMLFDVVDGRYRFLASGTASSTTEAPFFDIGEGIRRAIDQLHSITGREFIGRDEQLIIPSKPDGSGVDTCVATVSAGAPLKVVAVGLLEDISAESAVRLASTTYAQVVDTLSLNDRRKQAARIDSIMRLRPDLVIVAGGTDNGASQSVISLLEPVGLACYLSPERQRPEVLYAGNQSLVDEVEALLGPLAHLSISPNIRPALDVEQLSVAQPELAQVYRSIRIRDMNGVLELDKWAGGKLIPTATAFGRMIRFLSHVYDSAKGVFGVNVGASATVVAAGFSGDLHLGVYPDLGLGPNVIEILENLHIDGIARWLPVDIPANEIQDYIYNKSLAPYTLPASQEVLALEQALARQVMQMGVKRLLDGLPFHIRSRSHGLMPLFEPIVATGSVLTNAPSLGQSLLTLLDGLQPTGVTTMVLDQNNIMPALGAAAGINSILPVQVLESSTFINLGTVISPSGNAPYGALALRVKVKQEGSAETTLEIKHGTLEVIPLPLGKAANLHLQPLNRFDVGMGGPGRGGSVRVVGGALGVIIDARGRPLRLPKEDARRRDLLKKWIWTLGG